MFRTSFERPIVLITKVGRHSNLSSDEDDHVDCVSVGSVGDVPSSSDEDSEEIELLSKCSERELDDPIPISTSATALMNCSDCVVCGKTVQQIQSEAANDYLARTMIPIVTLAKTEAMRRAFSDDMSAGTFLFISGGVSQAATCDLNFFYVPLPVVLDSQSG